MSTNKDVLSKIIDLYEDSFEHDGFSDIRVEMKVLKRGEKEIIIHCGKQYRYLVPFKEAKKKSYQVVTQDELEKDYGPYSPSFRLVPTKPKKDKS